MKNTREIGEKHEIMAAKYLKEQGYTVLETNYRVRQAELDIVAMENNTLVFAEVKYRKNEALGNPLSAVGYAKQKKISKAALFYMNQHRLSVYDTSVRFDVIGILGDNITHIKNAFYYVD